MSLVYSPTQRILIQANNCLNYDNYEHLEYLFVRFMGIETIKNMSSFFKIQKETMYKAIYYLDSIFLQNESIEQCDIIDISKVCLIMAIKFNEINCYYSIDELIKQSEINDYHIKEIQCLKLLNYSLGKETVYDCLLSLIYNEFSNNDAKLLDKVLEQALIFLYELVEDIRFLDFNSKEAAVSIIKICTQIISIPLAIATEYQLKYNNICYIVFNTIISDTYLIVFIPKPSLYPFEYTTEKITHVSMGCRSGSTSDSNCFHGN